MSVTNAKTFEKQFNEYFSKLIYATFEDIERDWNGEIIYNPNIYQSYQNLCREKKNRGDGLKNRFTVSDPARQFLTFLFGKMIDEIRNVQLVDGDSPASIADKLIEANAECYTSFMYEVATLHKNRFGETLRSAGDASRWFHNQIVGFLPQYATKPVLLAIISEEFDSFLKALAWLFGKLLWYYEVSISEKLFLGTLAQQGINQEMLDVLHSSLRAKPAPRPRARKAAAPAKTEDPSADPELAHINAEFMINSVELTDSNLSAADQELEFMLASV